MKILFIKNVPRQGQVGEVKEVPQGFAQHLINNSQAIVATDSAIKNNQRKVEEANLKSKGEESMAHEIAKRVENKTFTIKGGASNKGSLYKALHKQDILDAISKEIIVTVPENLIGEVNLKSIGKHILEVVYKNKKLAKFEIEII